MSQPANRPARPMPHPPTPTPPTPRPADGIGSNPSDRRSAFSRARETAQGALNNLPFVSSEGKERLYAEFTPLWLHAARLNTGGQFGERWLLEISENDPGQPKGALTFARNDYRDNLYGQLANELASDPTPIGPLLLSKIFTRAGQESWDIVEWTEEATRED
jgi:hypothetical protein